MCRIDRQMINDLKVPLNTLFYCLFIYAMYAMSIPTPLPCGIRDDKSAYW